MVRRTAPTRTPAGAFFVRHLPLFIDYLSVEKGLAANSLEAYRRDLTGFGVFLSPRRRGTLSVPREKLATFFDARTAAGAPPRPIPRATSAPRRLFPFLAARNSI